MATKTRRPVGQNRKLELKHVLRDLRFEVGLTQTQLAQRTGFDQTKISRWEHGRGEPDVHEFITLVVALEAPWMLNLQERPFAWIYTEAAA